MAVLKFPAELSAFLRLIEKTPVEKQAEIIESVNSWLEKSAVSDNAGDEVEPPKWDK